MSDKICFRLPKEIKQALKAIATEKSVSLSELLREILNDYIKRAEIAMILLALRSHIARELEDMEKTLTRLGGRNE